MKNTSIIEQFEKSHAAMNKIIFPMFDRYIKDHNDGFIYEDGEYWYIDDTDYCLDGTNMYDDIITLYVGKEWLVDYDKMLNQEHENIRIQELKKAEIRKQFIERGKLREEERDLIEYTRLKEKYEKKSISS